MELKIDFSNLKSIWRDLDRPIALQSSGRSGR